MASHFDLADYRPHNAELVPANGSLDLSITLTAASKCIAIAQ